MYPGKYTGQKMMRTTKSSLRREERATTQLQRGKLNPSCFADEARLLINSSRHRFTVPSHTQATGPSRQCRPRSARSQTILSTATRRLDRKCEYILLDSPCFLG